MYSRRQILKLGVLASGAFAFPARLAAIFPALTPSASILSEAQILADTAPQLVAGMSYFLSCFKTFPGYVEWDMREDLQALYTDECPGLLPSAKLELISEWQKEWAADVSEEVSQSLERLLFLKNDLVRKYPQLKSILSDQTTLRTLVKDALIDGGYAGEDITDTSINEMTNVISQSDSQIQRITQDYSKQLEQSVSTQLKNFAAAKRKDLRREIDKAPVWITYVAKPGNLTIKTEAACPSNSWMETATRKRAESMLDRGRSQYWRDSTIGREF